MLSRFLMQQNLQPLHKVKQMCSSDLRPPGCRIHFGSMFCLLSPASPLFCRAVSPGGPTVVDPWRDFPLNFSMWQVCPSSEGIWASSSHMFTRRGSYGGLGKGDWKVSPGKDHLYPQCCSHQDKGRFGKEKPPSQSLLGPGEWQVHGKITLLLLYSHTWDLSQEFLEDFFRQAQGAGRGITSPRVGYLQGRSWLFPPSWTLGPGDLTEPGEQLQSSKWGQHRGEGALGFANLHFSPQAVSALTTEVPETK